MPNHVYMNMHIFGTKEEIANFFEKHFDDDNYFDFETFKKMPDELRGTKAPCETNPELIAKYGYDNWYDWHLANWGTKWNSYENEIQDNVLSFQTAWSMPEPIFAMMAEMYPTMTFEIHVVEEGGMYAGTMLIAEGKVKEDLTDDIKVWRKYATEFMGWSFEEEEAEEREDVTKMLDLTITKHKGNGIITELARFAKENIDDFIKFSKP